MAFATWGVYAAVALAIGSVVIARNAGMALDLAIMRALFVFVLFTALGFGAEALLSSPGLARAAPPAAAPLPPAAPVAPAFEDESV